jgi:hypothetical protein
MHSTPNMIQELQKLHEYTNTTNIYLTTYNNKNTVQAMPINTLTTMANQTGVMSKNAGPKIKMNNAHVATATTTNNGRSKRLRTTGLSAEKITLVMNTCKDALVMKP